MKNLKKAFIAVILCLTLIMSSSSFVMANEEAIDPDEIASSTTTIATETTYARLRLRAGKEQTITKTKTTSYKNADGKVLWKISLTATFTYDGSTSKCTKCSHTASAPASTWSIKSSSSSKSHNKATATVIAVHSDVWGIKIPYKKTITLTCSADGKIS